MKDPIENILSNDRVSQGEFERLMGTHMMKQPYAAVDGRPGVCETTIAKSCMLGVKKKDSDTPTSTMKKTKRGSGPAQNARSALAQVQLKAATSSVPVMMRSAKDGTERANPNTATHLAPYLSDACAVLA